MRGRLPEDRRQGVPLDHRMRRLLRPTSRQLIAPPGMARVLAESPSEAADDQLRLSIDQAPPLPATDDWLTDSGTMVLDPTQMPPDAELETKGLGLNSDIVV